MLGACAVPGTLNLRPPEARSEPSAVHCTVSVQRHAHREPQSVTACLRCRDKLPPPGQLINGRHLLFRVWRLEVQGQVPQGWALMKVVSRLQTPPSCCVLMWWEEPGSPVGSGLSRALMSLWGSTLTTCFPHRPTSNSITSGLGFNVWVGGGHTQAYSPAFEIRDFAGVNK